MGRFIQGLGDSEWDHIAEDVHGGREVDKK